MRRYELTDEQWNLMEHLLPGREGDAGRHGEDNRRFVNAIIWIARSGAPWRDLPERFGDWNSVYQRFNRWAKSGVWARVFQAVQLAEVEALLIDSTIVRAHQHAAAGAEKKRPRPWDARGAGLAPSCTSPATGKVVRSSCASVPANSTT
jgi:transposase